MYEIEYEYKIKEYGVIVLPTTQEDAEQDALDYIKETYQDITDIEITNIRLIPEVAN